MYRRVPPQVGEQAHTKANPNAPATATIPAKRAAGLFVGAAAPGVAPDGMTVVMVVVIDVAAVVGLVVAVPK